MVGSSVANQNMKETKNRQDLKSVDMKIRMLLKMASLTIIHNIFIVNHAESNGCF